MFRTAAQQPAGDVDPRAFRQSMFEAEDSRAADPAGLATLLAGVESPDPEIRRLAVRALGRLERAELAGRIAQLVDADQPTLRAEAVNALGQSLQRGGALSPHVATLRARLDAETDPDVRGVVAAALGRLPYQDVLEVGRVEAALRPLAGSTEPSIALGAVNGLESLARLQRDRAPLRDETLDALRAAARTVGDGETTRRVRRLALSALIAAGAIDAPAIDLALEDGDPQVRRLAALALVSTEVSERAALVARGDDRSVRDGEVRGATRLRRARPSQRLRTAHVGRRGPEPACGAARAGSPRRRVPGRGIPGQPGRPDCRPARRPRSERCAGVASAGPRLRVAGQPRSGSRRAAAAPFRRPFRVAGADVRGESGRCVG